MELGRRDLLLGLAATGAAATAQTPPPGIRQPSDPTETIDLWPGAAPGMPARPPVEQVDERSTDAAFPDRAVRGVVRPRMVVFRPTRPNGAAVLVAPGGGYARIVIDKEGYEVARWLAERGYTVFVLFYRLPGDGWAAGPDVALSDAQRAMRLIRQRAAAFGLDPARVAMMGFSAGGHLCGDLATRFDVATYRAVDAADRLSARPMLAAPIYAVQSMSAPLAHPGSRELLIGAKAPAAVERAHSNAANVSARTPPIFMVHAEDDATVPVDNTLEMRAACKRAGVPVETHLFTTGGHGFGLRRAAGKPAAIWPTLFVTWARSMGLA
jgi:acetyl esterase/lipase